jgi:CubicO group peptidase (beta-lactamase class C family)
MNSFHTILFMMAIALLLNSCKKLSENPGIYQYSIPVQTDDGLEVSSLQAEGLKEEWIVEMTRGINADYYKNIHSVVIVKNNKLVYENYFNGYDRKMLHNLYSATKSFTSALIGIAIDKNLIPDTNTKVLPYFPEYAPFENDSPQKEKISIRHLLTMSSGLACNDWDTGSPGRETTLYKNKDMLRFLWNLPMVSEPGENPMYCSGGVITLSNILSKSTGQTYTDFARSSVLEPLGINNYKWNFREKDRTDRPDEIFLRPRDMAKFGMLYLNEGKWQSNQIVSKEWVKASFEPKVQLRGINYGFLWWLHSGTLNGVKTTIYTASGNGGQFIYIIPTLNMVVVMTGGNIDSAYTSQGFSILYDYILPATF